MDLDDGPDFSYAYGGTSAKPTTSWNPAMRPDHEQVSTTQSITKSPKETTEATTTTETVSDSSEEDEDAVEESNEEDEDEDEDDDDDEEEGGEEEEEEEEDEEEDENKHELSTAPATHVSNGVFDKEPRSDEDSFDRFSQSVPQPPTNEVNGHGDNGVEEEGSVSAAQALRLGDQAVQSVNGVRGAHEYAEHKQEMEDEGISEEESSEEEASEEDPAENYEHQGDTTLLEEAVNEGEKVPLVADTEAVADDWGAPGEVFDLGGNSQYALLETPMENPLDAPPQTLHAEAAGTTVGDQLIGNTTIGGNTGEEIDWGNANDQEFFGVGAATVEPEVSATQAVEGSGAKPAAVTDSIWDLALDDDFLPDNDDSAIPFELDDEGFLEDEPSPPVQPPQPGASTASKYAPQVAQAAQAPQPAATSHNLQGSRFTDFSQIDQRKPTTQNVAYGGYNQAPSYQQPARPAMPSSAQSFADKAKGGYSSPYDLPEDVVTTRRRPAARTAVTSPSFPPPRTGSGYPGAITGAPRPPPPMSAVSMSPPSSSHSTLSTMTGMPLNVPPKLTAPPKAPSSDFFAELPNTSKPKPSGRYSPSPQQSVPQHHLQQHPQHHVPPPFSSKERTPSWSSLRNEVLPDLVSQLQQPEPLPAFPDQRAAPVRTMSLPVPSPVTAQGPLRYSPAPPSAPAAGSRYSPVPPPTSSAPPAPATRYSPATPAQGAQGPSHGRYVSDPPAGIAKPPVQPYAPRTSSPLAFHTKPQEQQGTSSYSPEQPSQQAPGHHSMLSTESITRLPFRTPLEGVSEIEEQAQNQVPGQPSTPRSESPPLRSSPSSLVGSPRKRTNYAPQYQPAQSSSMASPPQVQSQSPLATMNQPLHVGSASNHGYMSPPANFRAQPALHSAANVIPHRRQASHDYSYITPQDERAADPLERWKGYPIFKWGLGGTIVTNFPKQIPRYGGGASVPMMTSSPGEVKIQSIKEIFPLLVDIAKFPGPLKAKSKKKEVSAWLGQKVEALEIQLKTPGIEQSTDANDFKRLGEKLLLWKLLRVLVDNDGLLEGNATVEAAVRKLLSPEGVDSSSDPEESFATAADLVGRSRSNTVAQSEPIDPRAIENLRSLLTTGDREKAVWHAVDQRLWAHAMLLSSTLSKDVWKQVIQEYVRKEVRKICPNNQALSVLYEVFAGNHEDCIDELVPASARAGFQMVSTDGAGSTQNALHGLDKWRETLSLILSNRSEGDVVALHSLGKLLLGYGRVEAAHICFIFARTVAHVGGVDDAQSDIVLVGADHRAYPLDLGIDLEPVLFTEVYEFALSLSAQGGSHIIPHLQNYKLAHAYTLAEYGHRADAQAYCDAIAAAMKLTTRISAYYNGSFVASLDDLGKRLSQSPKDNSSWISKPSMDKVSSSLLSKFNSFIAGDDEEQKSSHSGGAEVGPFARIPGSTPQLSPSHSSADLYGALSGFGAAAVPTASMNSKYAPSNAYAPRTSLDQGRPRFEPQGRPSLESTDGSVGVRASSDSYLASPQFSGPYTPSQSQNQEIQLPRTQSGIGAQLSYGSPYQPISPAEEPAYGSYRPHEANFDQQPPSPAAEQKPSNGGYEPLSISYEPHTNSYEPPTNSYEPPAYEPYNPEAVDKSPVDPPKKKQFYDDDDTSAPNEQKGKSEADRKADEAFRKAAEADAQKNNKDGKKAGWFGGWFKKDVNAAPGPIKAKLGEENSFHYDPDLKKWVNKKAGAAEVTRPMATPPPPKSGPPARSVSGNVAVANHAMGLPSSLPQSSGLGASFSHPLTSNSQRSSSMPPPMGGAISRSSTPGLPSDSEGSRPPVLMPPSFPSSGPHSRPGTGLSTASSIDDLLGAFSGQKGTVRKKKKTGRYVDVMAQGQ